jgi:hypothetical protein
MRWSRQALGAVVLGLALLPRGVWGTEHATGDAVLAAARGVATRFTDKTSHVTMTIRGPDGDERVRTLLGREKRTDEGRSVLWLFESPAELAGTAFLAHQRRGRPDEMWVYFPGQRRVRRVPPGLRREQFQGSTFTYEDLTTVFYVDYDGKHELRGVEPCGDARCYVVATALPAGQFRYDSLTSWIRVDNHLPHRIDLTAPDSVKHLHVRRWEEVAGVPTVLEVEMATPADGWRTVVVFDRVRYDSGLRDDVFSEAHLARTGK